MWLRCTFFCCLARKAKLFDSSVLQAARDVGDSLRHSPRATQAARGYIYKVVLLLRKGRRRPGRSRRRLVRRADVVHASVAREVAVHAAVDVRPNGEAGAVRAQRDRGARLIAGVLAVNVAAELCPVGPIVLEDAGVARVDAVAAVEDRPDGEAGAVRAQRDRPARLVVRRLAVDVAAELNPVGPVVFEDVARAQWRGSGLVIVSRAAESHGRAYLD